MDKAKQRYLIIIRKIDFSIYDTHGSDVVYVPYDAIGYLIDELEKIEKP